MTMRLLRPALVLLAVILVTPLAAAPPGGPSSTFRVTGDVAKRTSFDLESLEALPVTKENVTYFAAGAVVSQSFTGTLLWDLLQSVGIVVDPTIKNDILRKVVIVTGSDGYQSVFGAGEIDPTFGGAQIMVAYAADGKPLGKDGFAHCGARRQGWWPVCLQHREDRGARRREISPQRFAGEPCCHELYSSTRW